ncbi:MAG: hypothetical protein A2017_02610 [Lentisphaerae bacterium GWF2_44_16]|nr:MAG: hypothetical protein A2017_02610 [Lentisphaerae bacterium GWF2_44_16]
MRKMTLLISCLSMGFCIFAENVANIVKNGEFNEKKDNGMPVGWVNKTGRPDQYVIENEGENNFLKMKSDKNESIFLLQTDVPLEKGKTYHVSCRVKSDTESKYIFYIEWINTAKKSFSLSSRNSTIKQASKDWREIEFEFEYPESSKGPYLALNLQGPGEICFDDIEIIEKN